MSNHGESITNKDEDAAGAELHISFDAMITLDEILGRLLPHGSIDIEGPAQALVTELVLIARRTFGTVHLIMDWSINVADPDRTEDAAALLRRLLDLYGSVAFVLADSDDWDTNALRCELGCSKESGGSDARRA